MEDLKYITASNIINLRNNAGMTQSRLAELLNYSDKSVSKWERAEGIPDAYVLKKISEIFNVSVDYLLSSHDQWEPPKKKSLLTSYQSDVIISIALTGVGTLGLMLFVIFWLFGNPQWIIFVYACLVSLVVLLVLESVLKKGQHNYLIIAFLVFTVIASIYFSFLIYFEKNFWQLFLLVIPGWIVIYLTYRLKRPKKSCNTTNSTDSRV